MEQLLGRLAALNTIPACLFNKRGELLWRSTFCTGGKRRPEAEQAVLGLRWQEFIHSHDLPRLRLWLAGVDESETITFRCMFPSDGSCGRVVYARVPCGENWLVVFRRL